MLTINDLAQSKLRSSSLDKLHGQRKAIDFSHEGSEVYDFRDDEETEKTRQELEEITSKTICVIDKGGSFVRDFFNNVKSTNPAELIDLGDFYEIKFPEFSLYWHYKAGYYWDATFMDAREIVLPPKSTAEKGPKRLYVLAYDGKMYNLPELEYPRAIAPFLKWLKKKKKMSYTSAPAIWNGDRKIYNKKGELDWVELRCGGSCYGYPVKNLKSKDDLREYNVWLLGEYKTEVEKYNKTCGGKYFKVSSPTTKLDPTEIDITQTDIDDFIKEWNNKYQVKR